MTSLKDLIDSKKLEKLKESIKNKTTHSKSVRIGGIYKIKADETNGITPKDGLDFRYKHFVVMGVAVDGSVYGCVTFNSELNRNFLQPNMEDLYIQIDKDRYSFLKRDSVIDCSKLKEAKAAKLLNGKYEGQVLDEDFNKIMECVKISPRHSYMYLKMLGILN